MTQLSFEERKEADSSTMQASHRVSRGIHNKVSGEHLQTRLSLHFIKCIELKVFSLLPLAGPFHDKEA